MRGFTIVELLIVIVIIGILAALVIVAYIGIQNRANDTVIQSDIAAFAKKVRSLEVDSGVFPAGGAVRSGGVDTGNNTTFPGVTFKISRAAYAIDMNNVYYCTGVETATSQPSFRIIARSKSGNTFSYISSGTTQNLGNAGFSSTICLAPYGNAGSWTYGYNTAPTWHSWVE